MKKLIIGNWKLNGNIKTIKKNIQEIEKNIKTKNCEVSIAPPIIYLQFLKNLTKKITITSQNIDKHLEGAYTGEISGYMLKNIGVKYVIIGHSERRKYHLENNKIILKKIKASIKAKLHPILCIGENNKEYDQKKSIQICYKQIKFIFKKNINILNKLIIAYEPIWAIGTGKNASITHINKIHNFLKKKTKHQIKILYGGSVNKTNFKNIIIQKNVDGLLIGTSSLDTKIFVKIINTVNKITKKK